ncbi:MAG: hypothetical protein HY336_02430 [Candidatus Doudnabacteria bacterium]|nr:hypothetical protein [Candidatus Doudnabacteria bacterium]
METRPSLTQVTTVRLIQATVALPFKFLAVGVMENGQELQNLFCRRGGVFKDLQDLRSSADVPAGTIIAWLNLELPRRNLLELRGLCERAGVPFVVLGQSEECLGLMMDDCLPTRGQITSAEENARRRLKRPNRLKRQKPPSTEVSLRFTAIRDVQVIQVGGMAMDANLSADTERLREENSRFRKLLGEDE